MESNGQMRFFMWLFGAMGATALLSLLVARLGDLNEPATALGAAVAIGQAAGGALMFFIAGSYFGRLAVTRRSS